MTFAVHPCLYNRLRRFLSPCDILSCTFEGNTLLCKSGADLLPFGRVWEKDVSISFARTSAADAMF